MENNIYGILINGEEVAQVTGYDTAWEVYHQMCKVCEASGTEFCDLVDYQTGEVIDSFNDTEDADLTDADFDDYGPSDLDMGFDTPEVCHTFDC